MEECVTKAFNSQIYLESLESGLSKNTVKDTVVSFTELLRNTIICGKSLTRNQQVSKE